MGVEQGNSHIVPKDGDEEDIAGCCRQQRVRAGKVE
jgi:hypothetical protein